MTLRDWRRCAMHWRGHRASRGVTCTRFARLLLKERAQHAPEGELRFPRRPYRGPIVCHLAAVFLRYRSKSARWLASKRTRFSRRPPRTGARCFAIARSVRSESKTPTRPMPPVVRTRPLSGKRH
jgi:hypothetical protein